ncbi:MAG: hypothetical protein ABW148_16295 [Sedimenticola sp.]
MDESGALFTMTAEALLSGEILCAHRTPEMHTFLEESGNREAMGDFLRKIGRRLSQTNDHASWFALYRDMESAGVRKAVGRQFGDTINNLEPLVIWLQMSGAFGNVGRPIQSGDTLRTSELLAAIESAPALCEELQRLSNTKLFSNTQSTAKGQLDAVLRHLVTEQYLVPVGRSSSQYIATGKWSRLYDLLEFIAAHEQLDMEEDDMDGGQTELDHL